jgi:hypothetical protein
MAAVVDQAQPARTPAWATAYSRLVTNRTSGHAQDAPPYRTLMRDSMLRISLKAGHKVIKDIKYIYGM